VTGIDKLVGNVPKWKKPEEMEGAEETVVRGKSCPVGTVVRYANFGMEVELRCLW
jgi:hypothetical protein